MLMKRVWMLTSLAVASGLMMPASIRRAPPRIIMSTSPDVDALSAHTVKQLKELLRTAKLPVSGKKAELIDRLRPWWEDLMQLAAEPDVTIGPDVTIAAGQVEELLVDDVDVSTSVVRPSPELGALEMAKVLCTALRDQDEATALCTLFEFTTPQGRVALAPPAPRAGRRSSVDEATFVQTASHPLLCLLGCDSFRILGEPTVIPPTQTREGLATVKIEVNPRTSSRLLSRLSSSSASVERSLAADGEAPLPPRQFVLSLEQQRRPPLQGCWLLKEGLAMERSTLQMLNEGSTEQW